LSKISAFFISRCRGSQIKAGYQHAVVIYQDADKQVEVQVDSRHDTVWLNLQQLADLFARDKSVISRHLRNIYKDGELDREATVVKNATVQIEGNRQVQRQVEFYNLDAIISVGYRVNSRRAVQFRQWAIRTLREHLTRGWTLNQRRFEANARELNTEIFRDVLGDRFQQHPGNFRGFLAAVVLTAAAPKEKTP